MLAGNGTGGWVTGTSVNVGALGSANLMAMSLDFSGDGKPDLIFRSSANNYLYMLKGNGTGGWISATPTQIGGDWSIADLLAAPGDFNGDGKADLVYRNSSDKNLYMVAGNGTGGWVTGTSVKIGIGWGLVGYCPGPALVSLASLDQAPLLFVLAMLVGMGIYEIIGKPRHS